MRTGRALVLLAVLGTLAYAPFLTLPLFEDDFPNLWQAQQLGSPAEALALLHNPVFRLRATSFWLMFGLWQAAKLAPLLYHAVSLVLHIANTWLFYAVCLAWPRLRRAAFWAAAFFAVAEGHQEAVIWFSAVNELFQFLFGMAALYFWLRGRKWDWAGVACFAAALLSKESAVVVLALLLLTRQDEWRRTAIRLLPYLALAAAAVLEIAASRHISFRFNDGSFSLHAPFWLTLPRNYVRVLSLWGLAATAAILAVRNRELLRDAARPFLWIALALLPYSFLTYSTQIPSRQTYLASAGVAMLVGLVLARVPIGRRWVAALAVVMVLHNVGYLWIRKRSQFAERAAPTEQLIELARRTGGPIWMRCFPRNHFIAEQAAHLGAGLAPSDLIWDEQEAERRGVKTVFCYPEK